MIGVRGIGRRQFLTQGSGALVHLVTGGAASHAESRWHPPEFRVALPIPPVQAPVGADATTDYYELAQREAWVEIVPGVRTRIRGYDGCFPWTGHRGRYLLHCHNLEHEDHEMMARIDVI